jgi:hypothetical protein
MVQPVVFCMMLPVGHDTKIFMNATQPPSKRSRIERTVDNIIFFMFGLLLSMCLTGCIYFGWWTANYMPLHWYLAPFLPMLNGQYDSQFNPLSPATVGATNFVTAFILYGK